MTLEDIRDLYGAPATPPSRFEVVDLCSPDHPAHGCTNQPDVQHKSKGWVYQNDFALGKLVRIHPGGRVEEGSMSAPPGAAFLVATFENGDTMDANNCLCYTVLLYFVCM